MNTLRTTRCSYGLTQASVAASAKISLPTLRALERGEGGVRALVAVMAVLDLRWGWAPDRVQAARALADRRRARGLSQAQLVVALAVFYIVLGCFLDGISMVVLTMGVLMPTVNAAGIDPIWFGVFVVLVVEMAQITPPVGFNLFVLQGMTGKDIAYIARVTMPFFFLMCAMVLLLWFFPQIATWMPGHM